MTHRILRVAGAAILAMGLATGPASAQLANQLTSLDPEQAKGYLDPFNGAFSSALNAGIFRTGNVPASGFNFTIDLKSTWYTFSDKNKTYMSPDIPGYGSIEVPTVVGDGSAVTQLHASGAVLAHPGGFQMDNFAAPIPQLSIGSIFGTRAIIRYIDLTLGGENDDLGNFTLRGIGGQHSLSQHLPGIPIDLALGAMYQQVKIGDDVLDSEALTFNITGSKKYGQGAVSLEPYGSMGMDSFQMKVKYEIADEPIEVEFDRISDFFFAAGASLNLSILKLHAEYRHGADNAYAGGISLGTID